MSFFRSGFRLVLVSVLLLAPAASFADTNCEEGAGQLNPAQPNGTTTQEIIQRFVAREDAFRQARNNYTYTQDITIQELEGATVTGDYRLVQEVSYSSMGERFENVTFAPQSSLRALSLSKEDHDDFRTKSDFIMTSSDLPHYNLLYVGQQHVDEIDTYVFDAAPKVLEKGQRYFQGRLWVDQQGMQIVKSCGKSVPEGIASNNPKKKKKGVVEENLSPTFVTYRELIDGQYWFPTYVRSDDTLHFRNGDIQMREIIKLTGYKHAAGVKDTALHGAAANDSKAIKKP
jgi:hypothetical protein